MLHCQLLQTCCAKFQTNDMEWFMITIELHLVSFKMYIETHESEVSNHLSLNCTVYSYYENEIVISKSMASRLCTISGMLNSQYWQVLINLLFAINFFANCSKNHISTNSYYCS